MNSKIIITWFVGVSIFTLQSCIKHPDAEPNTARGNFEALWKIVDTRYCYLAHKGIDWNGVYARYSPHVDTISSKYTLFGLLSKMLAELKDGHVNLYSEFDRSRYWNWYTDYPPNFYSDLIYSDSYLGHNYRIAGPFRYKLIANGRVGYVYYNSFSSNFSASNIKAIFELFAHCDGLILDVRNNGGGLITNSELLASYFFTAQTLIGYLNHKTGAGHTDFSEPIAIYTRPNESLRWERPVAVLTNRMSYSATNEFVCRMKHAPRSTIVGDITGGGGGMPLSSELPNGWMVRFSASPMYDAQMQHIEEGIAPDVKVEISTSDKENGKDTIIEKAVELMMLQ